MINGLEVAGHSPAHLQRVGKSKNSSRPPGFRSKKELSKYQSRENSSRISSRSSISSSNENPQENVSNQSLTSFGGPPPRLNLSVLSSSRTVTNDLGVLTGNSKPWNLSVGLSERSSELPADFGIPDDFLCVVNRAASSIQIWYRYRLKKRRDDEMKKVLESKKQEKVNQLKEEDAKSEEEKNRLKREKEEEKRNQRKEAIEELRKKREERAKAAFELAEKELKAVAEKKKPVRSEAGNLRKSRNVSSAEPKSCNTKNVDQSNNDVSGSNSVDSKLLAHENVEQERDLQSSRNTTIEDLFDTLKQLEEPETFPESLKTQKFSIESTNDPVENPKMNNSNSPNHRSGLVHSQQENKIENPKLNEILEFLDQADKRDEIASSRIVTTTASRNIDGGGDVLSSMELPPPVLVPSAEDLVKMEEANKAAAEVTDTLLQHKLDLAQKTRTVEMLTKALNQQRDLTMRHAKEQDRETKRRLNELKSSLEQKITRQTGFIDQLIESNSKLSEKCQSLTTEIKDNAIKYEKKLKQLSESQEAEKKKLKDTIMAAEKLRREKWMDEQTRNLKDITVKGLEPEIQKLIAGHKAEMRKLKTLHEAEIAQADERAALKYTHEKELMRNNLQAELESACEKERELARQRYEKQLEQEELNYQQQRNRLYAEVQEEKSRLNELAHRQRQELDLRQKQLEESNRKMMEDMRKEYEKARMEQSEKHDQELRELREKVEVERASWEETYMKKQEALLMQKERELTEKVRQGRDKEIELVISRLESDMEKSRQETEKAAENRVKRVREKYESEMRELEAVERNTMERYNSLKAQYAEVEGENARLKTVIKEKDHDLEQITKVKEKLTRERDSMSDVIRQEFADRLVSTEDENKRLKSEMSELKAKNRLEIDRITRDKEEEMTEVHKRVKQALVKKEEIVSQIRSKYEAAEKRADHLESLLGSIRKQNTGSKNK